MKNKPTLYQYLHSKFSNLEQCIRFCQIWYYQNEQTFPDRPDFGHITLRAMAKHCSKVLEGYKKHPNHKTWYSSGHLDTKYGREIYWGIIQKKDEAQ